MTLPELLDGHRFDIAVVGVQHHSGNLINCRGDAKKHHVQVTSGDVMQSSHICSYSCNSHVTRHDDVLDAFAGVVCDADVDFDGLPMIVDLKTGSSV